MAARLAALGTRLAKLSSHLASGLLGYTPLGAGLYTPGPARSMPAPCADSRQQVATSYCSRERILAATTASSAPGDRMSSRRLRSWGSLSGTRAGARLDSGAIPGSAAAYNSNRGDCREGRLLYGFI